MKIDTLKKILVLTDSERCSQLLQEFLKDKFNVFSNSSLNLDPFTQEQILFEYILIDYLLLNEFSPHLRSEAYYKDKLDQFTKYYPHSRFIILSDSRNTENAASLLKIGFHSIIPMPLSMDLVCHWINIEEERVRLEKVSTIALTNLNKDNDLFQTSNQSFANSISKLNQVAKSRSTILITGETGTGKSLLAKHIHQRSGRESKPFIDAHCGAIPESLIESELFGHEKGSFTGAIKKKVGKFELANHGTIFLDELGTINHSTQVRLLQVLQERFIQRVGGEACIPLDIRVIAATNCDLKTLIQKGQFREDLYYRLNVFQIEIPPLRERKDDIPYISKHIINKLERLYGKGIHSISDEVLSIFNNYPWPGNVRELENIIERAYILETSETITPTNIPLELIPAAKVISDISPLTRNNLSLSEARKEATEAFEKRYLTELLIAHNGKVTAMASEAQVSIRQLHKLLAKHNIKAKQFALKLILPE